MKLPLVLLHGALGAASELEMLDKLLSRTYKVYRFNFEGHGGVMMPKEFSLAQFSANLHEFICTNGIENSNVFGYSMGGYVALHYMSHYSNNVQKLITLGTKFDWSEASAAHEVKFLNPEMIEEKVPRFAQYLQALHHPTPWKIVVQNTAGLMLDLAQGTQLTAQNFKHVQQEVVLLLGSEDEMVSQNETLAVAQQLPNAKFRVLEEIVHPITKLPMEEISSVLEQEFNMTTK